MPVKLFVCLHLLLCTQKIIIIIILFIHSFIHCFCLTKNISFQMFEFHYLYSILKTFPFFTHISDIPSKGKVKGPLEMRRSSEKQEQLKPGVLGMRTCGHDMTPSSTESVRQRVGHSTRLHHTY